MSAVLSTRIKVVSFRVPNDTDWSCQLAALLVTHVPMVKKSFMNRPDTWDQVWGIKDPLEVRVIQSEWGSGGAMGWGEPKTQRPGLLNLALTSTPELVLLWHLQLLTGYRLWLDRLYSFHIQAVLYLWCIELQDSKQERQWGTISCARETNEKFEHILRLNSETDVSYTNVKCT